MARKVKCQITGEWGTSDDFIKIDGKYYKSQEVYDVWRKEADIRAKVIDVIVTDFLHYAPGQVFPTVLTKKLKELEFYGYDVILKTIQNKYSAIEYSMTTKDFANDMGRISYIMAIIKNNINDVYRSVLAEEKVKTTTVHEIDTSVDIDNIQATHKEKDISKFLEDDDWL